MYVKTTPQVTVLAGNEEVLSLHPFRGRKENGVELEKRRERKRERERESKGEREGEQGREIEEIKNKERGNERQKIAR